MSEKAEMTEMAEILIKCGNEKKRIGEKISPKDGKCWKGQSLATTRKYEKPKKVGKVEIAEILIK